MTTGTDRVVLETTLEGLALRNRGKVRDLYDLGDRLLIVASDRISAFDVVLPNGIPDKGRVLTRISLFWFDFLKDVVANHLVTADTAAMPPEVRRHAGVLEGRAMLVRKAKVFPVECIVRGYLSGSGWKDYRKTGAVCGIPLPAGLRESDRLPEPVFTPSTKAEVGHDENISFQQAADLIGTEAAGRLRDLAVAVYVKAADHARARGILLADTKFEFGELDGRILLVDEVLTPDSSRFWPAGAYQPGQAQPSFDKQFVRDYLETLDWDKRPPGPRLPDDVVAKTAEKYREAYRRLTGRDL
jgi:phosphoribosylaminoimidazole-succinocarboxamide synthase